MIEYGHALNMLQCKWTKIKFENVVGDSVRWMSAKKHDSVPHAWTSEAIERLVV